MYQKYDAYKDSGVQWLGNIPNDWEVIKLKFITFVNQQSLPENYDKKSLIGYVDIGNVSFESGIKDIQTFKFGEAPSRARRLAKVGDTVVSTVRTYLKAITYVDKEHANYVYSTGFAILSPKNDMNPSFLVNFIKSNAFTNQVDVVAKGMSYPAINSTDLSNLWLVLPTKNEQQKIVAFLDKKTTQIDQAITIKEQQIALLNERKQIVIQQAVTKGLDPNVKMKDSGVEWIGKIPEHWEVFANRAIFSERNESGRDGLPLLSVSIHTGVSDEEMDEDTNVQGRVKIEDKSKYILVKKGDIAFNMMRAWQGAIGAVSVDGMVSPAYIVAKPTERIDANFFEYQYRCPEFIQQMGRYSKGITDFRKRLYWDGFKQLSTIVPPISEQLKIIEFIKALNIQIETVVSVKTQQIQKLKEYKTTLINDAVTGKIKVA